MISNIASNISFIFFKKVTKLKIIKFESSFKKIISNLEILQKIFKNSKTFMYITNKTNHQIMEFCQIWHRYPDGAADSSWPNFWVKREKITMHYSSGTAPERGGEGSCGGEGGCNRVSEIVCLVSRTMVDFIYSPVSEAGVYYHFCQR